MQSSLRFSFFVLLCVFTLGGFGQIKTDNLLLYMQLDGNAADSSGNGYHGTYNNVNNTFDRIGIVPSSAADFDGTTSFVQLPNQSALKPTFPISISFWINIHTIPNLHKSLFRSDDNPNAYCGFSVQLTPLGRISSSIADCNGIGSQHRKTLETNKSLQTNKWYHVAVVYLANNNFKVYIDGVEETGVYSGTANSLGYSTIPGVFGKNTSNNGTRYVDVEMDELRVYSDTLLPMDVGYLAFEYPCIETAFDTTIVNDTVSTLVSVYDSITVFDTNLVVQNVTYYDSVAVSDSLIINSDPSLPANQQFSILLYPNPTKERLYIDFGSTYQNLNGKSMRILNQLGQIIYYQPFIYPFDYIDYSTLGGFGTYY
jgi:hypothetical protein